MKKIFYKFREQFLNGNQCYLLPLQLNKNHLSMKHLALLLLLSTLICYACSKDKTDSPFIGTYLGQYNEKEAGSSITLSDVTATIKGKTNNKLEVKLDLGITGAILEAQVVTDTQIFFAPQDYYGEEISGTGTLTDNSQKLTIEMERTTGTIKSLTFTGIRQ